MQTDALVKEAKRNTKVKLVDIALQIFLISIGIVIAMPILIALFTSFKPSAEVITYPPQFLTRNPTLENYQVAWTANPFGQFLLNSVIQSMAITVGQIVFSILAAYAFAFLDFPGKKFFFYLVLGSLMIPFELTFIPNFRLISALGWSNTYQGLVVPFLGSAFGVFLLRQFFLTVPRDLRDASIIDGANNWNFLWEVLIPLSKGSIGAFGIFAFLNAWNQYLWPLVATNEVAMRTIQIGIRFFMSDQERGSDWGAVMAAAIIALAPTLIAFLVAQKQLVKGIAMTGLKS